MYIRLLCSNLYLLKENLICFRFNSIVATKARLITLPRYRERVSGTLSCGAKAHRLIEHQSIRCYDEAK